MAGLLEGKSALITGGGGGIGRATALIFAREGARLAIADANLDAAKETVSQVNAIGGQAMSRVALLNPNGTVDTGFASPSFLSGRVMGIVASGSGYLVIGEFSFSRSDWPVFGGPTPMQAGIARINANGTNDTTFQPARAGAIGGTTTNPFAGVYSIAVQSDGKIVIGGQFSHVDGSPYAGAARLNADGTRDATFANPQIDGGGTAVNALAVQADGKVIIGGNFATVGGQTYGRVARLNADGTPDTGFENPTANSFASSIALQPDGKALIGGNFTTIRGTAAGYLARVFATSPQAAPTGVTATAGDGQATVSWTAIPGAITGYTATASPGGATCATTTATSCTITGLANGTTYTVAVAAENAFGSGPAASASAVLASRTAAAAAAAAKPSVTVTAAKARVTATGVIVTSQVTVSGAGRISQTATTGRRKRVVRCRVTKPVTAAGTYTLRCDLGAKGRTALRLRALKLTLRTAFTPTGADALTANRSITVKQRR